MTMGMARDSGLPIALVVDDDADIRHLLERVLTQSGFETVLTSNATDGIAAVHEFDPVITMLDVSMPGMDGFAAARRIREFSGTYIVMLTALADEIDVIQGLGAGADDYLLKPFRPRELRARIETLLRRPRSITESTTLAAPAVAVPPLASAAPVWTADSAKRREAAGGQPSPASWPTQPAPAVAVPQQAGAAPEPVAEAPAPPAAPASRVDDEGHQVIDKPVVHELSQRRSVDEWVAHRGLSINSATGEVIADGRRVELSTSEFALLATLMESGRRVRSTANLVLTLRGESYVTTYYVNEADKSAVKASMTNLRRKLGDTDVAPKWVESVRGVGYRMTGD